MIRFARWLSAWILVAPAAALGDTLVLNATRDVTLFEPPAGFPDSSNGAGSTLYVGMLQPWNVERRALVHFVLPVLPSGAVVDSVSLALDVAAFPAGSGALTLHLHRAAALWTEGMSNSGESGVLGITPTLDDATWAHKQFPGIRWSAPGGDYVATPTASVSVSGPGVAVWTSASMLGDFQGWLASPGTNFGWLLRQSAAPGQDTLVRLRSRESVAGTTPKLTIVYHVPGACASDFNGDQTVDVADLFAYLDAWFMQFGLTSPPADAQDLTADFNSDLRVDVADLFGFLDVWFGEFLNCP